MTGFIVSVFPFRNRVSLLEAFEGLELGEGKPSRPVLRGPGGRKAAWLLGSNSRKQAISQSIHRGAAPAGITGSKSAEGCSASCRIVLVAETNSRLVACSAPVFKLRSKRGKLLLETSRRRMWPFLKTLPVAHTSTEIL